MFLRPFLFAILAGATLATTHFEAKLPEDHDALQKMCSMYAPMSSHVDKTFYYDTYYTINLDRNYHNASEDAANVALYSPAPEPEELGSVLRCWKCQVDITGTVMKIKDTIRYDSGVAPQGDNCQVSSREVEVLLNIFSERKGKPFLWNTVQQQKRDDCQEALQNIQSSANRLIALVPINGEGITPVQFQEERLRHEQEMEQMMWNLNVIKRQAHQDAQEKVEQVEQQMEELKRNLKQSMEKVEQEMSRDEAKLLEAVALAIKSGEIAAAKRLFDLVRNKKKLSVVVKKAYNAENVDNMIVFSESLTDLMDKARMSSRLIDEILADVKGPKVLLADSYLRTLITAITRIPSVFHVEHVRQSLQLLKEARAKLQPRLAQVIDELAQELIGITEDSTSLEEFARERNGIFGDYYGAIITRAWSLAVEHQRTDSAGDSIVAFFEKLHADGQLLPRIEILADKLFGEMFKSDKVPLAASLRLIQNIKKQLGRYVSAKDNSAIKFLKNIVYGLPMTIENAETHGELMITHRASPGRNMVEAFKDRPAFRWHFETENGRIFNIRATDTHPQEWLYGVLDYLSFSETQRKIYTWRYGGDADDQGEWELRDADWRNQKLYIWNKKFGEYLNAESAGRVYSWRKSEGKGPSPIWKLNTLGSL